MLHAGILNRPERNWPERSQQSNVLPSLRNLRLSLPASTAARVPGIGQALSALSKLSSLETLSLDGRPVSAATLACWAASLHRLSTLSLNDSLKADRADDGCVNSTGGNICGHIARAVALDISVRPPTRQHRTAWCALTARLITQHEPENSRTGANYCLGADSSARLCTKIVEPSSQPTNKYLEDPAACQFLVQRAQLR